MISEKCRATYTKLNTFVTNVINRDVTPQITNLNETTTSLQETKLDNKGYITTSFNPVKEFSISPSSAQGYYVDDRDNIIIYGGSDIDIYFGSSDENEYYQFTLQIQASFSGDVLYICDTNRLSCELGTGTYTIKVAYDEITVNGTSEYHDGNLWIQTNGSNNEILMTFSNKSWYHEATFFDKIYPIGSIHITTNSVDPSNYFDGEWERIRNRFLLASGTQFENGSTGGSATVTLTAAQSGVPAHNHTYAHTDTTYKANSTSRKPGTATAANYVTSITATANNTTKTSNNNTAQNAAEAHNNMPPYLAVYMWERVG